MPRTPTNYTNTLIYKFVCKDLSITELYVGHTTSFKDRKREHKSRCKNEYPNTIYKMINANGGWDNWEMIEVEKFPCKDANEAKSRERYWYEELNAKLNDRSPFGWSEQTILNKKEYQAEYHKHLTEEQKQSQREAKKRYRLKLKTYVKED